MLVSDSQSMSVEAAVLGTPSIRYSGFAGRISVLEELEKKYQLTKGIPIGEVDYLFNTLNKYLSITDLKKEFQARKEKMLNEKIDVSSFLLWLIENCPKSIETIKQKPEYEKKFIAHQPESQS